MPTCNICLETLPDVFFRPAGRPTIHKPVVLVETCYGCRRREGSYKAKSKYFKAPKPPLREVVIKRYGNKCVCCGEANPKFLTIEHTLGNGAAERKRWSTEQMCRHIMNAGFPPEYSVLCMNCNWGKGMYGECPHKEGEHAL